MGMQKFSGDKVVYYSKMLSEPVAVLAKSEEEGVKAVVGIEIVILGRKGSPIGSLRLFARNREGFQTLIDIFNKAQGKKFGKIENFNPSIPLDEIINENIIGNGNIVIQDGFKGSVFETVSNKDKQYAEEIVKALYKSSKRGTSSYNLVIDENASEEYVDRLLSTMSKNNVEKYSSIIERSLVFLRNSSIKENKDNGEKFDKEFTQKTGLRFEDVYGKLHNLPVEVKKRIKDILPDEILRNINKVYGKESMKVSYISGDLSEKHKKLLGNKIKREGAFGSIESYKYELDTNFFVHEQRLRDVVEKRLEEYFETRYFNEKIKNMSSKEVENAKNIYRNRLEEELKILEGAKFKNGVDFSSYMYTVYDMVKIGRENDIACVGKGSAGCSLAVFLLGISTVDPIENNLPFERFFSGTLGEMPDIDVDSSDNKKLVALLQEKYGKESILYLSALQKTSSLKNIINELVKEKPELADIVKEAMEIPKTRDEKYKWNPGPRYWAPLLSKWEIDKLNAEDFLSMFDKESEHYKEEFANCLNLKDNNPRRKRYEKLLRELQHKARTYVPKIKGISPTTGSFLFLPKEKSKEIPYVITDKGGVTIFDKETIKIIGTLKFDILSSIQLQMLQDAYKKIGINPDPSILRRLGSEKVFDLIKRDMADGIFQLTGKKAQEVFKKIKPQNITEMAIAISVIRPGASKELEKFLENRENIKNGEPIEGTGSDRIDKILEETNGVLVFQEQILQILKDIGGLNSKDATVGRKAIQKGDHKRLLTIKDKFFEGAHNNGISQREAKAAWDYIESKVGSYSFNKSHAIQYAQIMYKELEVKLKAPMVYMSEFVLPRLKNKKEDNRVEGVLSYLEELKRRGIEPSVMKIGGEKTLNTIPNEVFFNDPTTIKILESNLLKEITNLIDFVEVFAAKHANKSLKSSFWKKEESMYEKRAIKENISIMIKAGHLDDILGINRGQKNVVNIKAGIIDNLNDIINLAIHGKQGEEVRVEPAILNKEEEKNFFGNDMLGAIIKSLNIEYKSPEKVIESKITNHKGKKYIENQKNF